MLTLLVKQITKSGIQKSWKLRPEKAIYTFGVSRLADLISADPSLQAFEGAFEFRNGEWQFIDFNKENFSKNSPPTVKIDKEKEISFLNSKLTVTPHHREVQVFAALEKGQIENKTGGRAQQIFLVKTHGRVVETRVQKPNKKFTSKLLPPKEVIAPIPSENWVRSKHGEFEVMQRTLQVDDAAPLAKFQISQVTDRTSLRGAGIVFLCSLLFGVIAYLTPKSPPPALAVIPQSATKFIVRTDFKKTKEQKPPAEKAPTASRLAAPPVASQEAPAAGKVAGLLKGIKSGRLSSILAKISAQAQKSKNAIVSQGVVAGSAPSGRALAAIGPIDKSGRDWNAEAKGTGVTISTSGLGGGKSINGLGQLSGGKVGQAGVGLIEDESEVTGGLDRDVIASYIKTKLGQILYCYERQLSANKDLFGKIAVKFTIGSSGQVEAQNIGDSTLKNATVEGCILNKVAQWKFPAPQGGTKVIVTYPFLFKSTN